MTRQKKAVLQALEGSGRSLHPLEIQTLAQKAVPSLNLSTVYRQLKTLTHEGRVLRVDLPGQPPRFEIPGAGSEPASPMHSHHHHFHCVSCKQVYPIYACPGHLEDLAPPGFLVTHHDLTLHGRCAQCAASR